MDHRQLMRAIAAGRMLVGGALVLAPGLAGSTWIGDAAKDRSVKVMCRAMGVRDLALGAGTLRALDAGEPARSWVQMGALSDVVDLAATAMAFRALGLRRAVPVMVVAATAAAAGLASADRLD